MLLCFCRLEQQRYSPAVIGRKLGGTLLTAMVTEMEGYMAGTKKVTWHHHSTHYPVST